MHLHIACSRNTRKKSRSLCLDCNPSSTQLCFLSGLPEGKTFEAGMRKKIQSQIRAGLQHNHDSLVLGAYGCGAFMQDSVQVANWYQEELAPYQKYFKKVTFAVLVARPSDQANFDAFQALFKTP